MQTRLLDDSRWIDKYFSAYRMTWMKLFSLLGSFLLIFLLLSCATNKIVVEPVTQVIEEKEGDSSTVLIMTERVFNYEPNSSELDLKDKNELSQIIKEVAKNQTRYKRIEIIGHSDQTGTEDLNLDISKERAISILEMMKEAGIDRKKIRTSWLAGTEPVVAVKDSSINRRVEIRFFEKKKTL